MKQTLYILIGVLISAFLMLPFAQSTDITCDALKSNSTFTQASDNATEALATCRAASPSGTCFSWNQYVSGIFVQGYGYTSDNQNHWFPYTSLYPVPYTLPGSTCTTVVGEADSDGDGRPDKYDAYPNDPADYQFQIVSRYYDSNGNCIGYMIYTSKGDYILMSDLTLDQLNTGLYTDHTLTSEFVNSNIWQDSSDLIPGGGGTTTDTENTPSGTANAPITTTDATRLISDAQRDTTAQTPATPAVPGSGTSDSQGKSTGDSDSDSLGKIVGNTDASNQNLKGIGEALGITNDLLAKINAKTKSGSGNGTGTGTSGSDLTAEDIGSAVGDALIDSGQTIDTTITDNIPSLDKTDSLASIKTKYTDRYDSFIDTVKNSDLFTFSSSIFTGPSGSGSSVQTVDIGFWGESSSRTATIDYSQYSDVWNVLSGVLLLLTSYLCVKIIILKRD